MQQQINLSVKVQDEIQGRQVKKALEDILSTFTPGELIGISKKVQLPLVKMKIRSML